jgi:hypothetical protein
VCSASGLFCAGERADGLAHERARRIGGDEVPLVGDVVQVDIDAPMLRLVTDHQVATTEDGMELTLAMSAGAPWGWLPTAVKG